MKMDLDESGFDDNGFFDESGFWKIQGKVTISSQF